MLRDIKASFFFFKLFDYIDEGNKLKLIKYNKKLQKNIRNRYHLL